MIFYEYHKLNKRKEDIFQEICKIINNNISPQIACRFICIYICGKHILHARAIFHNFDIPILNVLHLKSFHKFNISLLQINKQLVTAFNNKVKARESVQETIARLRPSPIWIFDSFRLISFNHLDDFFYKLIYIDQNMLLRNICQFIH